MKKVCLGVVMAGALCFAMGGANAAESEPSSISVFGAQRFWFATFEANALDVQIIIPQGGTAPVLRTNLARYSASDTLSITTLGVRFGKLGVFASIMPTVNSTVGNKLVGGSLSRTERDIGVSYPIGSGLSLSLVWKTAKVSPLVTPTASVVLRASGEQKGSGFLLGLSGSAALDERLSLYGNAGVGPVRWKSTEVLGPESRNKGRYTLAEVGLAYRLLEPGDAKWISNMSLQAGYRMQIASFTDNDLPTVRLDGTPVSDERTSARPLTQGMVLGLSATF